ncbi:MAG: hypothetical protein HUK20_13215 [Fibrobacter sp.]|nr:hypothetical protein [Fibrobacter sp.]
MDIDKELKDREYSPIEIRKTLRISKHRAQRICHFEWQHTMPEKPQIGKARYRKLSLTEYKNFVRFVSEKYKLPIGGDNRKGVAELARALNLPISVVKGRLGIHRKQVSKICNRGRDELRKPYRFTDEQFVQIIELIKQNYENFDYIRSRNTLFNVATHLSMNYQHVKNIAHRNREFFAQFERRVNHLGRHCYVFNEEQFQKVCDFISEKAQENQPRKIEQPQSGSWTRGQFAKFQERMNRLALKMGKAFSR